MARRRRSGDRRGKASTLGGRLGVRGKWGVFGLLLLLVVTSLPPEYSKLLAGPPKLVRGAPSPPPWNVGDSYFSVFLMLGWWLFVLPLPCWERTDAGTLCPNTRDGWLLGCGNRHRWQRSARLLRVLSLGKVNLDAHRPDNPVKPPAPSSRRARTAHTHLDVAVISMPADSPGKYVRDMLTFIATVAAAVAAFIPLIK
ncbi:MAG: hypothetical protein GEU94_17130 [Micromonosporaceae bacterium]|nr:hypothetical protein [Micromonosporaceae bacterium]